MLPIAQLLPSKTNPRKSFEGPAFDELVESIRSAGVIEPLIVRPFKGVLSGTGVWIEGKHEIVAGERRFRAAKKAGLAEVPVRILALNDRQAMEYQVIENDQREDVSPLEQARGYGALLKVMQEENPRAGRQELLKKLAGSIGKSLRVVYERLKLAELVPEVAKALEEGRLPLSHANEIVRLGKADQPKALKMAFRQEWDGGRKPETVAVPVRELRYSIQDEFHLELDGVGWKLDDAKLVPAAGACTECPKNLATDTDAPKAKPVCTDSACYGQKRDAIVRIKIEEARPKAGGEVLKLSAEYSPKAKDVLARNLWSGKEVKRGSCDHAKPGVVVDGREAGQVRYLCFHNKCEVHKSSGGIEHDRSADRYYAEQKARTKRRALELDARREALKRLLPKVAQGLTAGDLRSITRALLDQLRNDQENDLAKVYGWGGNAFAKTAKAKLATMLTNDVHGLLLACALSGELNFMSYCSTPPPATALTEIGRCHQVSLEKIRAELKEARKKKPARTSAPKQSAVGSRQSAAKKAKKKGGR